MAPSTENGEKLSPAEEHSRKAFGLAATDSSGHLSPFAFSRRNNGENDVTIKILFCGICHSDLHSIKNEWRNTIYPIVAGHEIAGLVTEVGSKVQKYKVGDKVGVGCMVNSCQSCNNCNQGFENYCPGMILTYNSIDKDGSVTYGGYSNMIVVNEKFVIKFPENLPLDKGAPLLCAGITVYSPMKYHGLNEPGKHLGVVGLGGLGHVAVKFGKAFGLKVTVISTSASKEKEAIERLGADAFLISKNPEQMQAAMGTMDGIIDTVSAPHSIPPLLALLKATGKMIMVGLPEKPLEIPAFSLIMGGKNLAGSCIGGIKDTQEMLDFAGKHGVTADIELISADYVNTAIERLVKADVRYRFVIDIANSLNAA
ncbi:probable cinnamyl alcohol dehydrogenase 5 [Ananas comosus]|uniref:cinnamyl-alcohol dehydrogenase n=1 Tax=Ananas comosus TaxID=4615 RepID=A0A6P5G2L4_ANACO|nr:probable cinnamyl alcohol dehydrogenase 5 [Ananas comosus]